MKVDLYKSSTALNLYLSVPAGTLIEKKPFPRSLPSELHKLSPHVMGLDVEPDGIALGIDCRKLISDIEMRGYAVQRAEITVHASLRSGTRGSPLAL